MNESYQILHVEDSPTQQILMQDLLEAQGWAVTTVASAQEAMEFLEQKTPHLVLIDYILPGMRGDELCRRIRLSPTTALVPVVLLTAGGQPNQDVGANEYLSKSTATEVLVGRLRTWLAHSASNR